MSVEREMGRERKRQRWRERDAAERRGLCPKIGMNDGEGDTWCYSDG